MNAFRYFPGFKATCMLVGILDMLMAGSMFAQGVMNSMAEFKVPTQLLTSPHYADAMFFVFLHMFMIGGLIVMLGLLAENPVKKVWASRALVLMFATYAYVDIQTSDNYFGNALYQGPRSVVPVFVDLLFMVLFLLQSFSKASAKPAAVRP